MSIPNCPVHGKPMRQGAKGGYFCATKMPDGTWCTQKASAAPPPAVTQEPVSQPAALPKVRLAEAALAFAGNIFHGSGNPVEAMEAAAVAYKWMTESTEEFGF